MEYVSIEECSSLIEVHHDRGHRSHASPHIRRMGQARTLRAVSGWLLFGLLVRTLDTWLLFKTELRRGRKFHIWVRSLACHYT